MVHFQAQHGARSPRSLGTSAAFLLLGFVVSGGLLLLLTGSGGVQRQLSSAAAAAARSVRVCPEPVCPDCPATLRKAAGGAATQQQAQQQQHRQQWHHDEPPPDEQQQQPDEHQEQQQADAPEPLGDGAGGTAGGAAAAAGVPLLCGGPDSVPSVQDSLAQAAAALEASLDASFEPFSKGFTLEDLMETAHRLGVDGSHDTQVWVEIRNQTVVFPRRENMKCTWFCNESLHPLIQGIQRGMDQGWLRIPEGLPMIWNVFDFSVCHPDVCTAPVLSIIRHADDADVPVPPFRPHFPSYEPHWVPWEQKADTAFFKGTPFCTDHPLNGTPGAPGANCSREVLPLLSAERPDLLNASITSDRGRVKGSPGRVPHAGFARHKYLLALDGYTASRRLATLLAMNSAVLKQASRWLEWYYAALRPCVHYLPFWQRSERDVLDVLRALRGAPANEAVARALAANGYTFAAAHLSEAGVYRHWQRVIDMYVRLYRGPADAQATAAALRWAERVGQKASAHGAKVEAKCWADGGTNCWYVGRDAAKAVVQEEEKKKAAGGGQQKAAKKGGGDSGGDGDGGDSDSGNSIHTPAER